jgi:hypothetical protein
VELDMPLFVVQYLGAGGSQDRVFRGLLEEVKIALGNGLSDEHHHQFSP